MPIEGYWNMKQVGRHHGVTAGAAYKWCKRGWLAAEQLYPRGPWMVRIEDAKAFVPPKAGRPWNLDIPVGHMTVAQVCERYGVSRSAVSFWIKHRGLKATKTPQGRWLIKAGDMRAFASVRRRGSRLHEIR